VTQNNKHIDAKQQRKLLQSISDYHFAKNFFFQKWIQIDWQMFFNLVEFFSFCLNKVLKKSFIVKSLVSLLEFFCMPFLACHLSQTFCHFS